MIFRHLTNRLAALFLIASLWSPAFAQTMDTPARHAILIEAETGEVLYEKEADVLFPPASMSKMMTVYIAFERIREGSLALEDTFTVSNQAWRRWAGSEASLMFVSAREEVTVSDLLHGIIVSSGNDACTVLAEGLAGTEGSFAEWMNEKAGEIGMRDSYFANASGWPDPSQHTTARDLAVLAGRLIEDFPDLYRFFGERSFTYGLSPEGQPITQPNRNPILYTVDGADGLKTGHTRESGYALTGSAQRAGRRIILVVSGLNSNRARARESQRLIEYAFRNFKTYATF
ncbi:MAG: D-alanyl-D-alanine carboxypeptidase, partial [Proteobacteria bacterium]|nr:D-alanyl-D-alanine carboxypeptidase [Pseudomonadota bacterium]